ncbi:hypothetical protein J2W56_005135 [Nocardia kruczakiae]|uniref:Uncharacterized protein n=1 Tax=Nocardia kruczakiae TaxID=261477 RepID=A0ABU1XLE1_9NOCA|nr:hypothetical protein [Nocardia kruczakiae]
MTAAPAISPIRISAVAPVMDPVEIEVAANS